MTKKDERAIGLVDCNNFFVSCERIFRPDLEHKPVLVLSSNDGCVISRSKEVKALGIPMGAPHFEVKELIKKHGVTVFSSNFTLYRDISNRVMEVLHNTVDDVEEYSIDEAFFRVTTRDARKVAEVIEKRIRMYVGIPVSVGVARTKTLAKYAGGIAKKGGCVHVLLKNEEKHINDVPLAEIWNVGRSTYSTLSGSNLHSIGDVRRLGASGMRTLLGVHGEHLYYELSGTPVLLRASDEHQKSIMSSRSFGKRVTEVYVMEDAISYHVSELSKRLRELEVGARRMSISFVVLRDGAKRYLSFDTVFTVGTSDTRTLTKAALQLFRATRKKGDMYIKAGAAVFNLFPKSGETTPLFGERKAGGDNRLMSTFDRLNTKYGANTVHVGTLRTHHLWDSKKEFLSPSYTTAWNALPLVKNTL